MPTLSYKVQGRFANNLIQYCIAKLLCKLFGHTLIDRNERGSVLFTDFEWNLLAPSLVANKNDPSFFRNHPYAKKNLRLEGFFQDSQYLIPFRQTILSLMTPSNKDLITPVIRVSDVADTLQTFPPFNEIVVHLRMDDFRGAGKDHSSVILHPNYFHQILPSLQEKYKLPIRIVFDRKDDPKEKDYVDTFARYAPIFQSSDPLVDFATLVKAKVLVSSNSTFSWMAGFLAKDQIRILPTIHHMGAQRLGKIDMSDEVKESFFITL
jgi:hypothetical protein